MRPMKAAIAASLPLIAVSAILPGAGASAASNALAAPTYSSTLVGAGQASMYPVDVTQNTKYYFVLDAGNYRVVAVNRTTGAIDCQIGGLQGNGPGQFGDARALDYDTATNQLYVADTPNNRVEIFSFATTSAQRTRRRRSPSFRSSAPRAPATSSSRRCTASPSTP